MNHLLLEITSKQLSFYDADHYLLCDAEKPTSKILISIFFCNLQKYMKNCVILFRLQVHCQL